MKYPINNKTLKFKRVDFGKKDTPDNLKEWRLFNLAASPVGTIEEIFEMIEEQNHVLEVNRLEFVDLDGSMFEYILLNGAIDWEKRQMFK